MSYASNWKMNGTHLVEDYSSCDCSGGKIFYKPSQCTGCGAFDCKDLFGSSDANQRRIWKSARVDSSLYTMNLAALTVVGGANNKPQTGQCNPGVNWNQSSDRAIASIETAYVSRNRTRHRPGGAGAAGPEARGVDVKHNSYARYLARLKGKAVPTIKPDPIPTPQTGNKQYVFGIVTKGSGACPKDCCTIECQ